MEEGKISCNHLIIAGILSDTDYARSDFLAMHLEQHLSYDIKRDGRLLSQWPEYYKNVLTPLGITGDDIAKGTTVIYTREGRVVGGYKEFAALIKTKFNFTVEAPESWLNDITKFHDEKAKMMVEDDEAAAFNTFVDALLKKREDTIEKLNKMKKEHLETVDEAGRTITELETIVKYLEPSIQVLYDLHHYPVKEESTEKESQEETNTDEPSSEQDEEEKKRLEEEERVKAEEEKKRLEEEEEQRRKLEEQKKKKQEEEEEEEAKEKKVEDAKPVEEEEVGELEPEAVELRAKLQESFKLPELVIVRNKVEGGDKNGLDEYLREVDGIFAEAKKIVDSEKFRWKRLESHLLSIKEKTNLAINVLRISVISAVELQIKAVEEEIEKYTNFEIHGVSKDVLEAASIKFAATFRFV